MLRVAAVMATGWGRSGDNKESCPLGSVSKGFAAWGAREREGGRELSRGTCPDSSVFWAEVSELCRPLSFARSLSAPRLGVRRGSPGCLLLPSPISHSSSGETASSFSLSPVWSQMSPTSRGSGREQTGHAGMSVWAKSEGGRQGRAKE